jgi:hypothetical protein
LSSKTSTKQVSFKFPTAYFGLILTVILLILKIAGSLGISWILVFLPVIIGIGLPVLFMVMMLVMTGLFAIIALTVGKK